VAIMMFYGGKRKEFDTELNSKNIYQIVYIRCLKMSNRDLNFVVVHSK
jgi:hypothetical protein